MARPSWLRPAAGIFALIALTWAALVLLVGGFTIRLGPLRLGSRDSLRAVILAALFAVLYVRLSTSGQVKRDAQRLQAMLPRPAGAVAAGLAVVTLVVGIRYGTFVAGSSDSYGYVSEAELWERGSLHVPQPLASALPWSDAIQTLAPLGYQPGTSGGDIVPTYPPGLPLVMVLFRTVFGARGQYYVVPVLGGLLVWLTYVLGRSLTGRAGVATSAALVVAGSPPVLFSLMWPMTDVPVAAIWTLALVLALAESPAAHLACGLTASLAVLIRPNLVPVALVFGMFLLWRGISRYGLSRTAVRSAFLFCAGVVPGAVVVAAVNNNLYGSPFASGYGELRSLYAWSNIALNGPRYARWIVESGCVYILVGMVAAVAWWPRTVRSSCTGAPTRLLTAGLMVAIVASYLFYVPFNDWWYLRFLLSVWPVAVVLAAALALDLFGRIRLPAASAVLVVVGIALFARGYHRANAYGVFELDESRYVKAARYIAENTEPDAIVLAMQHSGSLRYYAGRVTVRYDRLARASLDRNVEALATLGRHAYIVLDDWEEPEFRRHFARESALGRLDWPAIAQFPHVRVYDTRSRPATR